MGRTRLAAVALRLGLAAIALPAFMGCSDDGGDGADEGGEGGDGGDGGDGSDDGGGGDGGGIGPGEPAEGLFEVVESELGEGGTPWARVLGSIVDPRPVYHRLADESGACQLWTYEVGECSGCDGLCNADGECIPLPVQLSAGTLTLSGLAEELTLPFREYGYMPESSPPADLFGDDDRVTLEAAGGPDVAAFSLEVDGPPRIATDLEPGEERDDTLRLVDGQDLIVTWSPAVPGTRVRLDILSNNRGHGLPLDAMIQCEADDTGELVVAAELVEAFPNKDYSPICVSVDCPPSSLTRFRADRATIGGRDIELRIATVQEFLAVHE